MKFEFDFCKHKINQHNLHMKNNTFLLILLSIFGFKKAHAQNEADKILGTWITAAKDMKVEVYKMQDQYQAKVVWFVCDPGYVMSDFKDKRNPNPSLRARPWLGLNVLEGLEFKKQNEWINGKIYDPNSGRTFDSMCQLETINVLKVRGYWLYSWIGKSMVFHRVNN